jgi:hypothetical protein
LSLTRPGNNVIAIGTAQKPFSLDRAGQNDLSGVFMDYDYSADGNVGIVKLSGTKSFRDAKDAWERIRLAIGEDSLSALRGFEVIDLENWITQQGFPRTVKIAIVDSRPDSQSNNWFGETVARNRGWYNISVFREETSANNWLRAPAS